MHNDHFVVQGLAGEKKLRGMVVINGAKNAVLKAMAASVLFEDELCLENVPDTEDVKKLSHLLSLVGMQITFDSTKRNLCMKAETITGTDLDPDTTKAMRGSVMLTGPMLARYGRVSFSAPGGCVIGARPIDLYIEGYKKMGATIEQKGDHFTIVAPKGGLKAAEIFFPLQTVGGTETLMMTAVLAKGKTILKNCAMEPEIVSLAEFLVSCGATIKGIGSTTMEITGGPLLTSGGAPYVTIPDRIETGSFLFLGALCASELRIERCNPAHVESAIHLLRSVGVSVEIEKNDPYKGVICVSTKNDSKQEKNGVRKSVQIRTHEYPGFPTDIQSPAVTFLTQVQGDSQVFETIFEGRFKYVQDLIRMGADITEMNPREILIRGGKPLRALGKDEALQAHDIRAGFAIVMAALVAEGESVISNIYYIDRGYEKLEERLTALGASVKRVLGQKA